MNKITTPRLLSLHLRRQLATQVTEDNTPGQPELPFIPPWQKPTGRETGIRLHNCVARRHVPLIISNPHFVSWYTCGPTVYDSAHLGHASCYVKLDIIQRILREHFNFNIVTAMNITDIDDKIIEKGIETGRDWQELARSYEVEFWSDLQRLRVTEPNLKIHVSQNMPRIREYIEALLQNGSAYVGTDNSVYFAVAKSPNYGKLQNINWDAQREHVEKTDNQLVGKRDHADFALWKAQKKPSEPSWPAPWGQQGRPGWHIECSALAAMAFGGHNIDFHAGGLDLRFPHHENEEAQSCAYHDTDQWVNYWLHTGQLTVRGGDGVKMSKSLKNTISIGQMLKQYTADDFRMACILSNYRNSMEYSDELMETARNTLKKFRSFRADCRAYLSGMKPTSLGLDTSVILKNLNYASGEVHASFCDDFDTPRAISVLIDQISSVSRCINAQSNPQSNGPLQYATCLDAIAAVDNFVNKTLRIFGLNTDETIFAEQGNINGTSINVGALLEDILKTRQTIRDRAAVVKNKDLFIVCDELRKILQQNGIEIRDHSQGSSWSLKH